MKRIRKPLLIAAATAALLLGVWLLQPRSGPKGRGAGEAVDTLSEGLDLTYLAFNKNSEKKLEVRCGRSRRSEDGRLLMEKVTATIYKADKLDEDVRVFAASGLTNDDFNDLHLHGGVRIVSPIFTLESESFTLRGLNELSTKEAAVFKLRGADGRAEGGLMYVFSNKTMRMIRPAGTLTRGNRPYRFQARIMRLHGKKKRLVFEQEAKIAGSDSTLSGERIATQFDDDFANLQEATAVGDAFFRMTESDAAGRRRTREITAERIKMVNDPQGRLQSLKVGGNGVLALDDGENNGTISSQIIEIAMNAETQALEQVRARQRGELENRGRGGNIKVGADSLLALYENGALAAVKAEGQCVYATEDFSGGAPLLSYDFPHEKIFISGSGATVVSKRNSFAADEFVIRTRSKSLTADKGVKATLISGKKSVLLKRKPVYVTASALETSENGDLTRFKGKVNLFQDDVELRAGELLCDGRNSRMECRGGAALRFLSEGEHVFLSGEALAFNPGERRIVINGGARLHQGENGLAAQMIDLAFGQDDKLQEITASDSASFTKKDLSGKARLLIWHYSKKNILFRDAAEITRKGAGTTRGQELRFNLENNEIKVLGSDDRSETTILQERP